MVCTEATNTNTDLFSENLSSMFILGGSGEGNMLSLMLFVLPEDHLGIHKSQILVMMMVTNIDQEYLYQSQPSTVSADPGLTNESPGCE